MTSTPTDFTVFFAALAKTIYCNPANSGDSSNIEEMYTTVAESFYDTGNISTQAKSEYKNWLARWSQRIAHLPAKDIVQLMESTNPQFVLRNYLSQQVIDLAEQGDYSLLDSVSNLLRSPYLKHESKHGSEFLNIRPRWATAKPGCTMLTCSS